MHAHARERMELGLTDLLELLLQSFYFEVLSATVTLCTAMTILKSMHNIVLKCMLICFTFMHMLHQRLPHSPAHM